MYIVIGAILGLIVFESREPTFIGIIVGMTVGWALSQRARIGQLEAKVAKLSGPHVQPSTSVKPQATVPLKEAQAESRADSLSRLDTPAKSAPVAKSEPELMSATASSERQPIPKPPARPNFITQAIKSFFTSGNTIARVGVLLLFFGVAFLLKYVSDQGLLSIEQKLCGTALGGLILLGLGFKLRAKRATFGLILQGGGLGIFYLTVFAAFRLYALLPSGLALVLLLGAIVGGATLAVLQDSKTLAILSCAGGFLAPILTSTGHGSHVALFGFYAALNAGIVAIAWHKSWRSLNLVGFVFTFGIGSLWGAKYYSPSYFNSVEPFLILFFLFYFATGILFALKQPAKSDRIDGILVFGLPCITLGLQAGLVQNTEYGLALSTAGLGAIYILTARALIARYKEAIPFLLKSLVGIGIVFLTLTIPNAFSRQLTSAVWAIEGAVAVWLGVRDNRTLLRYFGLGLQLVSALIFLTNAARFADFIPLINSYFIGSSLIMASLLFSSFAYSKASNNDDVTSAQSLELLLYVGGLIWWVGSGVVELQSAARQWTRLFYQAIEYNAVPQSIFQNALTKQSLTVFLAFIAMLAYLVGRKLGWSLLRRTYLALAPLACILFLGLIELDPNPIYAFGWIIWPIVFVTLYLILFYEEKAAQPIAAWQHYLSFWLFTLVVACTCRNFVQSNLNGSDSWPSAAFDSCLVILALTIIRTSNFWPLTTQTKTYRNIAVPPLVAWLYLSSIYNNFVSSAAAHPLPYIPILNPLDLLQIITIMVALAWYFIRPSTDDSTVDKSSVKQNSNIAVASNLMSARAFFGLIGFAIFVWLTALPIRTIHHYFGVPWDFGELFGSNLVQMTLSIFWCLVALGLMMFAVKRAWRIVWISGAALLAIVVAKLLLVDLANSHTVERVITFIGCGLLLLLIGYLAPIPPHMELRSDDPK